MRVAAAGFRMQLGLALRTPNYWMVQVATIPTVIIFLSVVDAFDRPDLQTHALLAPTLLAMWSTALWTGGAVVRDDRWLGRLETHAAAPAHYSIVVTSRIAAVVALSLLVVPITLATAWLTYGLEVEVRHPWLLAVVLLLTAAAITGTGIAFSSLTILSRAAVTFQNAASYPFMLLSGAFVPLDLLPGWTHPLGRLVFLSWSSDLIRDAATKPTVDDVPFRLAMIVVLGAAGFAFSYWLVGVVLRRVRISGEISVA